MASKIDSQIDALLEQCISEGTRKSFFLFAGAGSGKTHSLVTLLGRIKEKWEKKLTEEGRHVAVITYTNAATDEIIARLDYSPLFHVSTIHSFVWEVIKPFQVDIKKLYICFKEVEKTELEEKLSKARSKNKTYEINVKKLNAIKEKIDKANTIHKFIYNPNGNNYERNALSHSDVIKIAAHLITKNDLLKKLIAQQFPFFLIDESQDTNKELINAFFEIQKNFGEIFTLGLFGDQKQRIYTDGEQRIVSTIPEEWEKPVKQMNYRSNKRIVRLANRIGRIIDEYADQKAKEEAEEGYVRLFLIKNKDNLNKNEVENQVKTMMRSITNDDGWDPATGSVKTLTLEHMMAARRLGFAEFLQAMRNVDKYGQALMQGLVSDLDVFTKLTFPLIRFTHEGDNLSALNLLKAYSPLLRNLPQKDAFGVLDKCRKITKDLSNLDLNSTAIKNLILYISENKLFDVPSVLSDAASLIVDKEGQDNDVHDEVFAWASIMNLPAKQIKLFDDYVSGRTMFDTHQGVKGLEFDRVQVIIDENESNTFLFNYDKLLGVRPLSDTDRRNINEGKESTIERTTRLFYVVCTRAKRSLAVTMYTDEPETAKATAISKEWFDESEIVILDI